MMKKILISYLIIVLLITVNCTSNFTSYSDVSIIINEFMVRNSLSTGIIDEEGVPSDWVEIYNPSFDTVFLGDFFISDRLDEPMKGALPDIFIAPGSYYLLWGGNSNVSPVNHIGFNFSVNDKKSEKIIIFDNDGAIIDSIAYLKHNGATEMGISFGRKSDGNIIWSKQKFPSPGFSNSG